MNRWVDGFLILNREHSLPPKQNFLPSAIFLTFYCPLHSAICMCLKLLLTRLGQVHRWRPCSAARLHLIYRAYSAQTDGTEYNLLQLKQSSATYILRQTDGPKDDTLFPNNPSSPAPHSPGLCARQSGIYNRLKNMNMFKEWGKSAAFSTHCL